VTTVTLLNPNAKLTFIDVPSGELAARAAVFEVTGGNAGFSVTAGPVVLTGPAGTQFKLQGPGNAFSNGGPAVHVFRMWVTYLGTANLDAATGTVTIKCTTTGDEFPIEISANTIERQSLATSLVLDRSGSMAWTSGVPNKTRMEILKRSAPIFVNLLRPGDSVGVVAFSSGASALTAVQPMPAGGPAALQAIAGLLPGGGTSIGSGVQAASAQLAVAPDPRKATIVFTDGFENESPWISDVAAAVISDHVYAIGLGTADQLNPATLQTLCNNKRGYMVLTGPLGVDDFRLEKYFLQVLAGVTNSQIVSDPTVYLLPGDEYVLSFGLTDADTEFDAILLSTAPDLLEFTVESPAGDRIDSQAGALVVQQHLDERIAFLRIALPLNAPSNAHEGVWKATVRLRDKRGFAKRLRSLHESNPEAAAIAEAHGIAANLSIHAQSSLRMTVRVSQSGQEPGSEVKVSALLTEAGVPLTQPADVALGIQRPDGVLRQATLSAGGDGSYTTSFVADAPGVYALDVQSSGTTEQKTIDGVIVGGFPFTRSESRTAAVWYGNNDPTSGKGGGHDGADAILDVLTCLLTGERARQYLEERGLDPDEIERCIREVSRRRASGGATEPEPVPGLEG
jgi:von Willebrand factor type A domain